MQPSGINRGFLLGLAASIALVFLNGIVSYRALRQILDSQDAVKQSSDIIASAGRLLSSVKDAETGQRGYLLTGEEPYLEPYRNALSRVENDFQTLAQAMRDPREAALAQEHLSAKLAELQETIELRRSQGMAAAIARVKTDVGRREMEELRLLVGRLQETETRKLSRRIATAQMQIEVANQTFLVANGVVLVLIAAIFRLLRRQAGQLESMIAQRTANLRLANQDLTAFADSISHDLRTPVRAMQGFAHALLQDYGEKLDGTAQDYLKRIAAAGERMAELLQDLLDYNRLSRAEIVPEPVNLARVVAEALQIPNQGQDGQGQDSHGAGRPSEGESSSIAALGAGAPAHPGTGGGEPGFQCAEIRQAGHGPGNFHFRRESG